MDRRDLTERILQAKRRKGDGADRQVYGPAIKALIHEDFGDGIMSAISFNLAVGREESADGPRVQITLNGKFLPYKW